MGYDTYVGSTRTCQDIAYYNNVATTMDTATFTLYNPNLLPIVGPIAIAAISFGVYQYAIAPGVLNVPGLWSQVWYVQHSAQSLQSSAIINVGPAPA